MRAARVALVATALALALSGCTGTDDQPRPVESNTSSPDPTQATTGTPSTSPTDAHPTGGTSGSPEPVEATTNLFDWTPVDGASGDTGTQVGDLVVSINQSRSEVRVDGQDDGHSLSAPAGFKFSDVISDGPHLVVVAQDSQEQKPSVATIIDVASGKGTTLDGDSDVPTTTGGAWAIGGGSVYHATIDRAGRYCLAKVDLATSASTVTYCAPRRSGFSSVVASPTATSLLTFGGQPQCRTPARLDGTKAVPLAGVTPCKGWDGAVTQTGAVWSVVKNESRVELGEFYASADGGYFDLGIGTTGTLTWCGDSAYFVRDAQKDVDKARLLRWTPDGTLEVVYESPGEGAAFLTAPRCAGNTLTVSAFGEGGDEQVSAQVP